MTWKLAELDPAVERVQNSVASSPAAIKARDELTHAGGKVFAVGGAIRDAYLGKTPKDIDILVSGLEPEFVEKILSSIPGGRVDLTGKSFGVFRFKYEDDDIEVALPRTEQSTGDSHQDFDVSVDHKLSPEEDMYRRDFTANAMAMNLEDGKIIDPHNGRWDIANKTLRVVRPEALEEDPLRVVRALVAYARHGLVPDEHTVQALRENAHRIRNLPGDRIYEEMFKLIGTKNPVDAISLAHSVGILHYLLPEVDVCFGVNQFNPHHDLDVGHHLLKVFEAASSITPELEVRIAALLHDIGKPDSMWMDDEGKGHFYEHPDYPSSANHDELGASMADSLLQRMRFPNNRRDRIVNLIRLHMFPAFKSMKGARKFLQRAGDVSMAHSLLNLREADLRGKGTVKDDEIEGVNLMRSLVDHTIREEHPTDLKNLAVNGHDITGFGAKGKDVGRILKELMEVVIDNPKMNDRHTLLGLVPGLIDPV